VDLPGYGYAKVSQTEKEKWGKMIERYLHKSKQIRQVFLLVDIRHEPGANDKQMYEWIVYNGYRPVIIATKLDKINRSQIQKHVKMIRTGLGLQKDDILIPFSSETKQGREEVWALIEGRMVENEAPAADQEASENE
jgi:GTP-binding protein